MPCFHPLEAWQTFEGDIHFYARGSEGKKGAKAPNYRRELKLPCGRCIGCRLDRSKQWAIRLMHEAQLHERTSFITLTYDNETLVRGRPCSAGSPPNTPSTPEEKSRTESPACEPDNTRLAGVASSFGSTRATLHYPHFQKFMRALRKDLKARRGLQAKIRFYMCGEYGEQLSRPHYHAAIFGEDWSENRYIHSERQGVTLWRSPDLERLWPHGYSTIGALTIDSAAYIARYVMKKMTGDLATEHYKRVDPLTGETYWLPPEFNVMSRKPGIGKEWIEKYKTDVYPHDYVIVNGHKLKPPRYYDKLMEACDKYALEEIKAARQDGIHYQDNTPARLKAREDVVLAKLQFKKRNLENT